MSELFLSTWGGSRRTNGGGTEGERVNSSVQIWRGVQDQTSPHPLLQYLLLFHWLQCGGKLQVCTEKTAWGQNAWGGEEWLLSLKGHIHIQRERESSGECLKSGWQSSLSLRYLSSLHASCSSHLPCSSSFAKSFFPQMLAHHFFFSCLVLLSLSLSVCQSLSLRLTASFFVSFQSV